MRIKSIFIIIFLVPSTAFATSIVAVRNTDEVVIGADSSTTLTRMDGGAGAPKRMEKCKIVQAGDGEVFFAAAGLAGIGPARMPGRIYPEFDLKKLIVRGLEGKGRIKGKVDNLEKMLVANLSQIAEKARKDNPAFFTGKFAEYPLFTIIIAGLDDGKPVLMVRTFKLNVSPSGPSFDIARFACPGDCRTPSITIVAGETGGIRRYLRQNAGLPSKADSVTFVRSLVEFEISKSPASVGPPVDILRLTGNGGQWVQKKSSCPDIRRQPGL
ncbi:MAG: hypothetical protein M0033_04580 [Nitrospiraceae bacterium]|nr:hypothetical protein [Nitrospiraceae bacterium]